MSDVPMDQDDDNDEFFSARDELKKAKESPPPQRSDRDLRMNADNSPSSGRKSKASRKSTREKNFFSDEKAIAGSDKGSSKRRKDKNKWDRREYKKEELDPSPIKKKDKKKKEVKAVRVATEEASKTDEESEPQLPPVELQLQLPTLVVPTGPQPRPYFQQDNMIMTCLVERGFVPKARYKVLKFASTQELVEFDGVGEQVKHPTFADRAITNNWRRWGAHRTLCDQGGHYFDPQTKRTIKIERGSAPPPCPTERCQITLNKNTDIPDSQSMFGSIKVESGPAVAEGHRIGKIIEKMVLEGGGFVPKKLPVRKALVVVTHTIAEQPGGGQPQVVVKVKQKPVPGSKEKPKKKEKGSKEKKKKKKKKKENGKSSSTETDSDEHGEDDGSGGKKAKEEGKEDEKDDSKKGRGGLFALFRRKKAAPPAPPKPGGSKEPRRRKAEKK